MSSPAWSFAFGRCAAIVSGVLCTPWSGRNASDRRLSCLWCGREIADSEVGRRRRYCRQSCRQRAYEHRKGLEGTGIPEDSVVLSAQEAADLADRWFAARCAAEDVATAVAEGADSAELAQLTDALVSLTKDAERLR